MTANPAGRGIIVAHALEQGRQLVLRCIEPPKSESTWQESAHTSVRIVFRFQSPTARNMSNEQ